MSNIKVIFQKKGEQNTTVEIRLNKKFSELIQKYFKQKCVLKKLQPQLKFYFMKKEIMPSSELTLKDLGIQNSSNIEVELSEKIGDSFSEYEEIKKRILNKDKALINFLPKDYKSKKDQIKKEIAKKYINTNLNNSNKIHKEPIPISTIEMIQDINNFSTIIKEEIIKKKEESPESIIPISEAVDSPKKSSLFALGILGSFLKSNGAEVIIEKENPNDKNNKEKEDYLKTSMMFATSEVGLSKKYELRFDVDENKSKTLLENEEEAETYLNSWRKILAKKMSVPEDTILFFNPRKGSYIIDAIFIQEKATEVESKLKQLTIENKELRQVTEKVIIEGCVLSENLLDPRYNKELGTWNRSKTNRGKEIYDPPHGWLGFGLNVSDKYENLNWLGKQNTDDEWMVVYHGIARNQTNVVKLVLEAPNTDESHLKPGQAQYCQDDIDKRHKKYDNGKCNKCDRIFFCPKKGCEFKFSFDKCSDEEKICKCGYKFKCNQCLPGVYCTPIIQDFMSYANNFQVGEGNSKEYYRIGFMCRANPKTIRQSKRYNPYYICSGLEDEIRPYRLLIKERAIELLEQWTLKKIVSIIFDSEVDNWETGRDFSNYIIGKSNLLFMIIDSQNNRFGGYISSQITRPDTYIADSNAFIFSLNSNGRLSTPTKFNIISQNSAFISITTHERYIFAFGGGYDLKLDKKSTKYMANSNPSSYDFGQNRNTLYGKTYPDRFTPKRWLVYQMK